MRKAVKDQNNIAVDNGILIFGSGFPDAARGRIPQAGAPAWTACSSACRAESFNIWNHPSSTSINTLVRSSGAGQPIENRGAMTGAGGRAGVRAPAKLVT